MRRARATRLASLGVRIVPLPHADYPESLRDLEDAPLVLTVRSAMMLSLCRAVSARERGGCPKGVPEQFHCSTRADVREIAGPRTRAQASSGRSGAGSRGERRSPDGSSARGWFETASG